MAKESFHHYHRYVGVSRVMKWRKCTRRRSNSSDEVIMCGRTFIHLPLDGPPPNTTATVATADLLPVPSWLRACNVIITVSNYHSWNKMPFSSKLQNVPLISLRVNAFSDCTFPCLELLPGYLPTCIRATWERWMVDWS